MQNISHSIVQFVATWGANPLVDLLAGSALTLIAIFFRQIGHFFAFIFKWLWAIINKRGKDYAFERAYLTWIINRHHYLGLLPARVVAARWGEEGRHVDLEKVYVSLHVSTHGGDKNQTGLYTEDASSWHKRPWLYAMLRNIRWIYIILPPLLLLIAFLIIYRDRIIDEEFPIIPLFVVCLLLALIKWRVSRKEETHQPGDLALTIDTHKQLVIRGDPGSGKTTLLRYLAVTCARTLRNSRKENDAENIVKKRLLWTTRPFPILVTLHRYSNIALQGERKSLIQIFAQEMPEELRKDYPEGFFERKLAKGNCLILLDAFDELGSPEARAVMARRIEDFLSIHNHPRNRVVATTRIVGYEGQLDRYGFQIRTVQPLEAGETRALIKQRYDAIALSETAGWPPHDAAPIKQELRRLSERLIKKVESTPRLTQLATNPLLLSLIVLVHRVKLELPEERVQLYRECVEILTEQWLRFKQQESDIQQNTQEELNLSQKLVLLQSLALDMQQKREEEDRQTLLPQAKAQEIIASKLPDILGSQLPVDEEKRREACRQKAETWVKRIQADSGILVEQGLDDAGNPLVGFSHLTFQEYLAASAINETPTSQHLLTSNLLSPVWREVLLLYVALTSDATSIIAQLLDAPQQPEGIMLAGSCLAEKVKHVKNEVQYLTLTKLKDGFEQADESMVKTFGPVLAAIGGSEVTAFMRGQLHNPMPEKRLEAIKALGQTKPTDPMIKDAQEDLVKLLETLNDITISTTTREALSLIGDPRFTRKEPIVVHIPQQTASLPFSPKGWKELFASPEWMAAKKLRQRVALQARLFDYWYFTKSHRLRQQLPDRYAFAISKYSVTNIEYARFVEAAGHPAPNYWTEGTYATEKATYPVTGITMKDAKAYCKWLSKETGETYRLPTEWEWEWAATGSQRQPFPWGKQFDKDNCNTKEATLGEIIPVGSYIHGKNQYGATDMIGNVWEITEGSNPSSLLVEGAGVVGSLLMLVGMAIGVEGAGFALYSGLSLNGEAGLSLFSELFLFSTGSLIALLVIFVFNMTEDIENGFFTGVLRGGAFDTPSEQATCFYRKGYSGAANNVGFRCVKEL